MALPELPHFDLPLRFENGQVALVEQATVEDVQNQVAAVVRTPIGFRDELPEFGITQPEFAQAPIDVAPIRAAVDEWVPEAHVTVSENGNAADEAIRNILIELHPEGS